MSERPDYRTYYNAFDLQALASTLHGDLETAINPCVECCDRHVGSNATALLYESMSGASASYSFEQLQERSAQVGNFLTAHGVGVGDRVAGLLPRVPDLVALVLGTWRAGAVYQPLFTAFGPKAIEHRLSVSEAKVIVTDASNRAKLDDIADIPLVMCLEDRPGDVNFTNGVDAAAAEFAPVMRTGNDPMLMMFTSGTTGPAKAMYIPIRALLEFDVYTRLVLEVRADDVFWNMADPGWAYGLYCGLAGPLLTGHQTTFYDGPFTVESTGHVIEKLGVTNLAAAPTAYRMIIAAGPDAAAPLKRHLRVASSAGEPLNPEVMRWFEQHVGCSLFDQYGQTECSMILGNHHGLSHTVTAGSAGLPMPGFSLAVVDESGQPVAAGNAGILAVDRKQSPLFFFEGYLGQEDKAFIGDYYLTGDTVVRNADGSITFVGRSDDVISSAGYRIGPFDVESCLLEHPAVAESGVVGKPDTQRGAIVKAFVVLHPNHTADDALRAQLQEHVRDRVGKHAFPREIDFVDSLPKTPSGKIQRFMLRNEP